MSDKEDKTSISMESKLISLFPLILPFQQRLDLAKKISALFDERDKAENRELKMVLRSCRNTIDLATHHEDGLDQCLGETQIKEIDELLYKEQ